MPINSLEQQKLDESIFELLHKHPVEEIDSRIKLYQSQFQISKSSLMETIENHYYLAPRNLNRAQILYGILSIIIALAIAAVKVGNNFTSVAFIALIGACLGLPYFIFALVMGRMKDLNNFEMITKISLVYTCCLALAVISLALFIQLYGIVLIPIVLTLLYFGELRKLTKLETKLGHG